MLKLLHTCAPWLSWKTAGLATLVALGVTVCLGMPSVGVLVGAAPVLLMIACLIPCLIPLMLLRKQSRQSVVPPGPLLSEQRAPGDDTCGCGQDVCGIGDCSDAC